MLSTEAIQSDTICWGMFPREKFITYSGAIVGALGAAAVSYYFRSPPTETAFLISVIAGEILVCSIPIKECDTSENPSLQDRAQAQTSQGERYLSIYSATMTTFLGSIILSLPPKPGETAPFENMGAEKLVELWLLGRFEVLLLPCILFLEKCCECENDFYERDYLQETRTCGYLRGCAYRTLIVVSPYLQFVGRAAGAAAIGYSGAKFHRVWSAGLLGGVVAGKALSYFQKRQRPNEIVYTSVPTYDLDNRQRAE